METWYEIFEVSKDGLLKTPKGSDYGVPYNLFDLCETIEEAERMIDAKGETYTTYAVLTMKRKT